MKMINRQMAALIKKDIRGVTDNKRMFTALLVVPLVMVVVLPSISIFTMRFIPDQGAKLTELLDKLPPSMELGSSFQAAVGLILNFMLPALFLMIPIMASSVMAASSFVGEKEKRTLETLLYCPLSLKQIFRAKVLASFLLSMLVSAVSFAVMLAVVEVECLALSGVPVWPDGKWALVMLLVAPAISLIAITLTVRVSAKAQSVEDAQQGAVFLIMPVILLIVGQFTGLLLISGWILLIIGLVCAALAFLLMKGALGRFQYEKLLR